MLAISKADVIDTPFPHVVKESILPQDLFDALKSDFPSNEAFAEQDTRSGGVGSRAGAGTGFDIYRGDAAYDLLVAKSSAWQEFDAWINSAAFVEKFLDVFGDRIDDLGVKVAIDPARYDRSVIEPREVLRDRLTPVERLWSVIGKIINPKPRSDSQRPSLFSRLDIEQSIGGYAKPPHCDRRNRVCSLIVYFTDLGRMDGVGGELNIYQHTYQKSASEHERHPKPDQVSVVQAIVPKENLGVFFPCSNNSYHGVNALRDQSVKRNFLYINISTSDVDAW